MANTGHALVIYDEGENRQKIVVAALKCGLSPVCCSNMEEARILLSLKNFRVVLCSDTLPDGDYSAVLKEVKRPTTIIPVIILSCLADWDAYLKALGVGAFDYIICPPKPAEAERILWSALADTVHSQQAVHAVA
jgi:DNA-binding NtrC family response regulator